MHVYIYTISGTDTDSGTMHWAPVDELRLKTDFLTATGLKTV